MEHTHEVSKIPQADEDALHDAALELVAAMVEKHKAETRYYAAVTALMTLSGSTPT